MYLKVEIKNEICDIIDRYCEEFHGPDKYETEDMYDLLQQLAKEHSAEYYLDHKIGCDVLVFEEEADYLIFKLKSNLHLPKET